MERLERAFYVQRSIQETKTVLQEIFRACSEAYQISEATTQENRDAVWSMGGTALLSKIVQAPEDFYNLQQPAPAQQSGAENCRVATVVHVRNDCLSILRELCYGLPAASDALGANRPLLIFLFDLMRTRLNFDMAVALVEEVLSVRKETFDLGDVEDLPQLVSGLSQLQLAYFCRILALAAHEPEERVPPEQAKGMTSAEILSYKKERHHMTVRNTDKNHGLLLEVPGLLRRLVRLVRIAPCSSNPTATADGQPANLTEILSGIMSLDIEAGSSDDEEEEEEEEEEEPGAEGDEGGYCSGSSGSASSSSASSASGAEVGVRARRRSRGVQARVPQPAAGPSTPARARNPEAHQRILLNLAAVLESLSRGDTASLPLNIKALTVAAHQVEVLFVLCTLLGGRRKSEVQEALGRAGLMKALDAFYDRLPWGCQSPGAPETHRPPPPHGAGSALRRPPPVDDARPSCECNPESALKVQFLRVVHNFCDRDTDWQAPCNKRLVLSAAERAAIASGSAFGARPEPGPSCSPSSPPSHDPFPLLAADPPPRRRPRAPPTPGLLSKMLSTLSREPPESNYKFWLSSCVEAFLRGSHPRDQLFAARSGLLKDLVAEITTEGFKTAGALQTAFDLLGELLKFSRDVYEELDACMTDAQFEAFMRVVVTHLVDSNVFLRSAMLSLHHFRADAAALYPSSPPASPACDPPAASPHSYCFRPSGPAPRLPFPSPSPAAAAPRAPLDLGYPHTLCASPASVNAVCCRARPSTSRSSALSFERCRLTRFLDRAALLLLRDLMGVVSIEDINQDNVCCLNSALLVLMFAHARGQLADYLAALKQLDEDRGRPGATCGNFRRLLSFWIGYYQCRGKDCVSLEFSSNIRFSEWEGIVRLLCGDPPLPTSL